MFDSFSAAKKTLDTFDYAEWFAFDKYWMDTDLYLVCEASDGKEDFDQGFYFRKGILSKLDGREIEEDERKQMGKRAV